jgi:hypothetical protein
LRGYVGEVTELLTVAAGGILAVESPHPVVDSRADDARKEDKRRGGCPRNGLPLKWNEFRNCL